MNLSQSLPRFGTDGWRAAIADQFTFANVRLVAQGIADFASANWQTERGIVVGYDTRFGSDRFARTVCEVLAANGVRSLLTAGPAPTPACSFAIRSRRACGGVIVTASHNPPSDNGIKVRTSTGAAVDPAGLAAIERAIDKAAATDASRFESGAAMDSSLIETFDPMPAYLDALRAMIDPDRLAGGGFSVVVDSMYGAGAGCMNRLFAGTRLQLHAIRQERNPAFPGLARPEPIPPHIQPLADEVRRVAAAVGIANDGDADRLGLVDEQGQFVDQLRTMALLAYYMLEYQQPSGPIVKTVTTSSMLDRIGEIYGVEVIETGVGMKYVAPAMAKTGAAFGGEESGGYVFARHMPERDGILAGLLFLDLMIRERKRPSELVQMLFSKLGREYHYGRLDLVFPAERRAEIDGRVAAFKPAQLDGSRLIDVLAIDGYKLRLADGSWVLIRFSGTEPLLRVYTETTSRARVQTMLKLGAQAAGL